MKYHYLIIAHGQNEPGKEHRINTEIYTHKPITRYGQIEDILEFIEKAHGIQQPLLVAPPYLLRTEE